MKKLVISLLITTVVFTNIVVSAKPNKDYFAQGAKAFFAASKTEKTSSTSNQKKENVTTQSQSSSTQEPSIIESKSGEQSELYHKLKEAILNSVSDQKWEEWEKSGGELEFIVSFPQSK